MATIIIFASLSVFSAVIMLFLIKRQLSRVGPLSEYHLVGVEPAWRDVHQFFISLLQKFWNNNAHKFEFFIIIFGKFVIKFIVRIENFILHFLNFIWGKCKIEKNNSSRYWQIMMEHKNKLNGISKKNNLIEKEDEK